LIHKLLLTDYVMPAWDRLVVNELKPQLAKFIPVVETAVCDVCHVCHSLIDASVNQHAASHIIIQHKQPMTTDRKATEADTNTNNTTTTTTTTTSSNRCLVVISYLLTETRGRWHDFFRDAFRILPPGTLMRLSEPVAWQLHQFLDMFQEYIDHHQWLDSSRDFPALQGLERRMGAAVVMVCTKQSV
jgi:hypothetical protein